MWLKKKYTTMLGNIIRNRFKIMVAKLYKAKHWLPHFWKTLGTQHKCHWTMGENRKEFTRRVKDVDTMESEDRLKELQMQSLEEGRLEGSMMALFKCSSWKGYLYFISPLQRKALEATVGLHVR